MVSASPSPPCLPGKPPLNPQNPTHVPPLSEDFPGCSIQSLPLILLQCDRFLGSITVYQIRTFSHLSLPDSELLLLLVLVFPATGTIRAHGKHSIMLEEQIVSTDKVTVAWQGGEEGTRTALSRGSGKALKDILSTLPFTVNTRPGGSSILSRFLESRRLYGEGDCAGFGG